MFLAFHPEADGGVAEPQVDDSAATMEAIDEVASQPQVADYDFFDESDSPTNQVPVVDGSKPAATAESDDSDSAQPESILDPGLVKQARFYGYTDEDLKQYKSADELKREINNMNRLILSRSRQAAPTDQPTPQANTGPDQTAAEVQQQANQDLAAKLIEFELNFPKEDWDEDTAKIFAEVTAQYNAGLAKLQSHYEQQFQQRDAKLTALEQYIGQQQAAEEAKLLDGWFGQLESEYAEVFGKGGLNDLAPDSPAVQARQQLVAEADQLLFARQQYGLPPITVKDALQTVLDLRYSPQAKQKAVQQAVAEVTSKVKDRRSQAISRPSSRNTPVDGRAKAQQRVRQFWSEKGVDLPPTQDDFADDFL